jgi:hypothetical protein
MPWITSEDSADIRKTLAELGRDSDRAVGIVGAVLVDESLTTLLKSRLEPDEELIRDAFRASGPLGAFSVKINIGFLMGLYGKPAWKELDTIRQIRNEFAHRIARSFSFERIQALSNNLSLAEQTDFYVSQEAVPLAERRAWLKSKPPAGTPTMPLLPNITSDKLSPRERYLRSCQFYSAAFMVTSERPRAMPAQAL